MRYGWTGKRLNVNLTSGDIWVEEIDDEVLMSVLGGRGLNIHTLLNNHIDGTEYDSEENIICFAAGTLTGTNVPSSGRYSVASKSPLTGLLGDANSGGFFGPEIKYAGYDQIVISGKSKTPVYLGINDDKIEIRDAEHLWGKDVWFTEEQIKSELNDQDVQIASIGQAGENLVRFAAVMNNLSRAAGRTGMGAVMGAKRLKAIVVKGTKGVKIARPEEVLKLNKDLINAMYGAASFKARSTLGTSMLVSLYNIMGTLPTRNGKDSVFEGADDISGEVLAENYKTKSKACFACPVRCSHYLNIEQGEFAGSHGEGVEFETMCSLGSNVGNKDLASIVHANNLCNKYGLDTLSTGGVIAFLMECYEKKLITKDKTDGLDLTWGNSNSVVKLIEKIALREGVGNLLAEGVKRVSDTIPGSQDFALTVKGMEVPSQDIRGLKAWGLGWAVSSRGADHCRAFPLAETTWSKEEVKRVFGTTEAADRFSNTGKPEMVKWYEEVNAIGDSLELCRIAQLGCNMPFSLIAEILAAVTGMDFDEGKLFTIGERVINLERIYNLKQGMTPQDDTIPKRFLTEPVKEGASKGNVFELEEMKAKYYELRNWDINTGWPKAALVKKINLEPYL